MENLIRIGTSGGQADLKQLLDKTESESPEWETSVTHFSVGLRFFEAFDVQLGARALANGISLAVHPVDINLSAALNKDELYLFKKNLGGFPFIYLEEDLGLWRFQKIFLGAHQTDPGFSELSLFQAATNAATVQEIVGIPVVIENPPVYSGEIGVGFWDYFQRACDLSGCQMAFDIGHYLGYCRIHNLPSQVPDAQSIIWEQIKTIHLSGMKFWRWNGTDVWLDQHADKYNDEMLRIAKTCVTNEKTLHNILLEMEGADRDTRLQNYLLINTIF